MTAAASAIHNGVAFHPDVCMLSDYAAGSLCGAFALPVSVHLEYCTQCRGEVHTLDNVGAGMFEHLEPCPVSEDSLDDLFAMIDSLPQSQTRDSSVRSFPRRQGADMPRALRELVEVDNLDSLEWKKISRSLKAATLEFGDHQREVALHHIRAGGEVVQHGHNGTEVTVVLRGSFSDQSGVYRKGDFLVRSTDDVHRPVAAQDEDCLCLSVLDAPIRLEGLLGTLARPFLRIRPR